jgi:hypothetical protein
MKLDNTNKVCSRWLTKGKTTNSFRCIVCNTSDLSCANGGWSDLKRHFDRPKHIQRMKDVFGSVLLVPSGQSSSCSSNNNNDDDVLNKATKMLEEESIRLAKAMSDREFHEIGVAEVLVTADNTKLAVLKNQLIENSESLNRLRKKQKKQLLEANDRYKRLK